jgi:DNA-directed RNA polymerase sigma subunit (sigma70/sigma32)
VATPEEISELTGVSITDVEKALAVATTVALETPVGEDGALLGDFITDAEAIDPATEVEYRIVEDTLRKSLAHLPDLHRQVLELRFGFTDGAPAAFTTVSNVTGVPEAEVRELVTEALALLAADLRSVEDMRAA